MLAPLIPTDTITRIRRAAGTRDEDGYTPGTETSTTVSCSVQPANGRDLQTLPEGDRQRDVRKLYAPRGSFRTADQHADLDADLAVIDGHRYEVRSVGSQRAIIPHDKVLAVRLQEAP